MTRTNRKFRRIRALACFREVRQRLCAGYPCPDIARYIQEEQHEYNHVSRASLAVMLRDFRSTEIPPGDLVTPHLPEVVVKATREYADRLEDLRRLDLAYAALLFRFEVTHAAERHSGKINPNLDRQARTILDLVTKMHDIRMDLGIAIPRSVDSLEPSPERLVEIRERFGAGAARAFADPVSRAKVLGLLKRVLRVAERTDLPADDCHDDPADQCEASF